MPKDKNRRETMMPDTPPHLFCFGLGYSASRLAADLAAAGWTVSGTQRGAEQAEAGRGRGYAVHVFDGAGTGVDPAWLDGVTHVLSSVPPGPDGDPVLNAAADILADAAPGLAWVGYLSTTGVYGDTGGAWVDETAALKPDVPRSARRVAAEAAWQGLAAEHGLPLHVFRLAGIYGPGRNVLVQARAGTARRIVKRDHQFSRIHVDDIAQVLRASMARPHPGAVYNVCDDEPAAPADVTTFACELLGIAPPDPVPFEDAAKDMSPMGLSFWADNRRVRNGRIKDELGVALRYPTYREGLRAIFEADFQG